MVSYYCYHRGNTTTMISCCYYYYIGSLCILLLLTNRANNNINNNNIFCQGFGGGYLYKNQHHYHHPNTYSFINNNIDYPTKATTTTTRTRRISYQSKQYDTSKTILFSISDWRDTIFDIDKGSIDTSDVVQSQKSQSQSSKLSDVDILSIKEICILPFDFTDVLVQGETKQLRLYEERFIQLFTDVKNNYNNVVAMGILADYGIVQIVPICEIEAYTNNLSSNLGIFVTIRIVGRAKLLDIIQQTPYIKATCIEVFDIIPSNLELPNLIANNIDDLMLLLSSMEYRLRKSKEEATTSAQNFSSNTTTLTNDEPNQKIRIEIDRKLRIRKLEDTFYDDNYDNDDDEDDDEEDDEDDGIRIDRLKRYKRAYEIALETDTQGYQVVSTTITTDKNVSSSTTTMPATTSIVLRNARELTAISWAAFCSDLVPTIDSIKLRILAINSKSLIDRLSIALRLLRLKKITIQKQLKDAGLEYKNNDTDNSIDSISDIIDDDDDDNDDEDDKTKKL